MQEWFNWHAWRACVRESVPRVRISLFPPIQKDTQLNYKAVAHQPPIENRPLFGKSIIRNIFKEGIKLFLSLKNSSTNHFTVSFPDDLLRIN
jgi:hypothetical protein